MLLLTLDNLGVDITALVAGLGIGGIAVALAVQNVLGDLFASLSITLFETVYFVLSADFNRYMDIQQAINLRLHRELAALGVEFAYPTQRLIIGAASPPDSSPTSEQLRHAARSAA